MQFRVLGSLEVRQGNSTVVINSGRQRTLLAALLAAGGAVVSVDALADALWGEEAPADPRNGIQTYMARLRKALGPDAPIVSRSPGYTLEVEADRVDARRFEQLLAEAARRRDEPAVARALLDEALALWRGPAYAEFADGVARAEALRLTERRLRAVEMRAEARLALGEAADLIGELEGAVADEPLREQLVSLLAQALAAADRQPEALSVCRRYRERLVDETGLDPSPALRDLEDRILRGELSAGSAPLVGQRDASVPPGDGRSSTATGEPARVAAALPVTPTSLVGRAEDLAQVCALLDRARVVTLTGPGGVGKTRIAAEAARTVAPGSGEVAWAELAPVSEPGAVVHVVAAVLGIDLAGEQPPRETLLGALAARSVLLVLDNCEHLLGAVAPLVEQIARRCPHARVLATSRERLAIDGEWVYPVAPLPVSVTDEASEATEGAVQLFVERAEAAGARFEQPAQLAVVAEICRHLDGLPLAIELAAARTGALALDELLAALGADATAAGSRRGESARHRDLWAVAEWSYRLLEPSEQQLFERLAVFAGAFGAKEAQAVCAEVGEPRAATVQQLAALAERSLLVAVGGTSPRYRMLRPLRAFARQRLADRGELAAAADRHAAVLTERAERAAGPPLTDEGRRWLEASLDDLRDARRRALLTGDANLLGRLIAALYRFDYLRPGGELIGWADEALELDALDEEPTAPQAYAAAAAAAWKRGDLVRARRLADRGVALGAGPDDPATATAYEAVGDVANFEGRLADSEAAFRQEVRLARAGGDPDGEVIGLASVALVVTYAGRIAEGVAAADAAADAAAKAGPATRAFARYAQGECRAETAPNEALALLDEAAALASACDASFVEGVAQLTAACLRGRHGDPAAAIPAFADLIDRWRRSGNWTQQWTTLRNLAELLVALGVDEAAVVIAAAATAEQTAAPTFGTESDRLGDALATARSRIGPDRAEAARSRGSSMAGHEVIDFALAAIDELRTAADRREREAAGTSRH